MSRVWKRRHSWWLTFKPKHHVVLSDTLPLPLSLCLVFPHTNTIFTLTHRNNNNNNKFFFVHLSLTKWRTSSSGQILPIMAVLWKGNPRNYFFDHVIWRFYSCSPDCLQTSALTHVFHQASPSGSQQEGPGSQSLSFFLMSSWHSWR